MIPEEIKKRILPVKLVLIDNDAVLTDGRIVYGDYGDELKFFDVQDGHGISMLKRAGLVTVILSGRKSRINKRRAKELHIAKVYQNVSDKLAVFPKILRTFKVKPEEVCYIGDDLIDLPILRRVGFAAAPANAIDEVKTMVNYVAQKSGGRGAVREVTDLILKSQGKWEQVTERYYR